MAQHLKITHDISPHQNFNFEQGEEWLVHCRLEGMQLGKAMQKELKLVQSGQFSPDEFIDYLKAKYTQPVNIK